MRIQELTARARSLLNSAAAATADVPKIRDDLIDVLLADIQDANAQAKQTGVTAQKGAGGLAPRAQWYRVIAYLVQVLDGVCQNVELSEINDRLMKVEKELGSAKTGPVQASRPS